MSVLTKVVAMRMMDLGLEIKLSGLWIFSGVRERGKGKNKVDL